VELSVSGQVEPGNDVWAPTADEVDGARRVIAAFDETVADGRDGHRRRPDDREPPTR
jgi:citrate lyase beta subunit